MCADSANARDRTIIRDALTRELGKHDVSDDVHERHCPATTPHETHPGHLREVSSRGPGKEGIL